MGESGWSFQVLGQLRVTWHGAEIPLGPPQARLVFALLLLATDEVVARARIADELWGEDPPASAKVQIQGLISRLRRALPQPVIVTQGTGYVLRVPTGHTDLDRFRDKVGEARRLIADGWSEAGAAGLAEALALWRGPALADVPLPAARLAADQWEEQRLTAIEDRMHADLGLGRCGLVAAELPDLIAANPFRERLRGHLMTALARCGRIAEALQVYRDWYQILGEELGVLPSPEVRALHCAILRAEPGLRPPGYATWRRFAMPCQLPAAAADFIGRHEELAEFGALLEPVAGRTAPPVLMLSASGGTGKSLLANRLAHEVKHNYPDGTLLVRLRATGTEPTTPLAALSRCLQSLDIPADMLPASVEDCAELFRDMLTGRRVLLVLDDALDSSQVLPLLPTEPGCAVIITARSPINGLPGVRHFPVGAMPVAEARELLAGILTPARLAAEPAPAAEILQHCQGIPLAVAIVGGRLADRPDVSLAQAAAVLVAQRELLADDIAVRAAFAFSHGHLEHDHQVLFRRLGLLPVVDFSAWVAEALLDGHGDAERLLGDLVRCHMVQWIGPGRYRLHDLLRSLAQEKAQQDERHEVVTRVLGGWLWLAERAAEGLPDSVLRPAPGDAPRYVVDSAVIGEPYAWFEQEHPALAAAVGLAADLGMGAMAWEIAAATASYFDHRGLRGEWFRCCQRALPAARAAGEDRGTAALLRAIGQLWIYWDDFDKAMAALSESRLISARIDDQHGVARAIAGTASIQRELGCYEVAITLACKALDLLVAAGDQHGAIQLRSGIAVCHVALGRLDEAQSWLDAALRGCDELGDDHRLANVLQAYAQLHLHRDDVTSALRCLGRALEMLDALRDERCTANARLLLGEAYAALGDHEAARNTLINASVQFVQVGNGAGEAACARLLGNLAAGRPG